MTPKASNTMWNRLTTLDLTARQAETLYWLAHGKSNGEIATILKVSGHTIRHHVESILARLGTQSRAEAMLQALETLGWLHWGAPDHRVKQHTPPGERKRKGRCSSVHSKDCAGRLITPSLRAVDREQSNMGRPAHIQNC